MAQKKVQILMSAYNGKKYITTQLDSILAQTWENTEVLVRDDGSTDGTTELLLEYAEEHPRVHVYAEKNVGLVQSFFRLMEYSDADFIGFSDQDDYWLPEKVARAVEKVAPCMGPALYCGNQTLVDADLNPLPGEVLPEKRPGFGNAVIESMCTGCTAMMNKKLRDVVIARGIPQHAIWHDWWCYLVASYLGTMIFDKNSYILYRQHGDNQLGSSRSELRMLKNKFEFWKKTRGCLGRQLSDFKERFRGIEEKDQMVDLLLDGKKHLAPRFQFLFNTDIYRQKGFDNFAVKVLHLFNLLL